jgi:thiol-disulfide isomerase/thioredoxin
VSVAGVTALAVVVVLALGAGALRARRSGRVRAVPATGGEPRLLASEVGAPALGERATLLQFSSAFCRPCVATRHVLHDVAGRVPGVHHVEVDAESRLDLVRSLGIASTPTTLVLDGAGVVRLRATGVPRRDDVLAALADTMAVSS